MGDNVHMCLSIPPTYAVANVVGYIKGKSAIQIAMYYKPGLHVITSKRKVVHFMSLETVKVGC
jgi:REP element-mobilizing transposase RayT